MKGMYDFTMLMKKHGLEKHLDFFKTHDLEKHGLYILSAYTNYLDFLHRKNEGQDISENDFIRRLKIGLMKKINEIEVAKGIKLDENKKPN